MGGAASYPSHDDDVPGGSSKASVTDAKRIQESKAKLFLNFDVNKTIVMLDSSTGTTPRDLMLRVLSESSWGVIEDDDSWRLLSTSPSSAPSEGFPIGNPVKGLSRGEAATYSDYLEHYSMKLSPEKSKEENAAIKKERKAKKQSFTAPGQPGHALAKYVDPLCAKLLLPEDKKELCHSSPIEAIHADTYFLIPAFFQVLIDLAEAGREFWVCFRTFGHDHDHLIDELNAFCNGEHPLYPGIKFDGQDGRPDLRVKLDGTGNSDVGCFERTGMEQSETVLHVGVSTVEDKADARECVSGFHSIFDWFQRRMGERGSFVIRDHYDFWASQAENNFAGKLHLVDRSNPTIHSIFFDDNIENTFAHIVDARDEKTGEKLSFETSQHCWYSKAVPLQALTDPHYFSKCIAQCEANIDAFFAAKKSASDKVDEQCEVQEK